MKKSTYPHTYIYTYSVVTNLYTNLKVEADCVWTHVWFYLLSVMQPACSATVSISVFLTAAMIVREIKENTYPCVM
jgi:hypothetical protein